MDDFTIEFVTPGGEKIELERQVQADHAVDEVRSFLGEKLLMHPKRISILWGPTELADGRTLREVAEADPERAASGKLVLTVVRLRCQVRPHEYQSHVLWDKYALYWIEKVEFPPPRDRNINMMPFIIGNKSSLPEDLSDYWPLLQCCPAKEERGKIGYLTIQEGMVEAGESQRRPGLHVESPGIILHGGRTEWTQPRDYYERDQWGGGRWFRFTTGGTPFGGIYMASTVSNSCGIYPYLIKDPAKVAGDHGDIEHLREFLTDEQRLDAGWLVWLTDRTPHESLPVPTRVYRQFFRFVTSDVSVWHEEHNTPNPLGIKPGKDTKIIRCDKFQELEGGRGRADEEPAA